MTTATLLLSGNTLAAGGRDATGAVLASAEIYEPGTVTPANLVSVTITAPSSTMAQGASQHMTAIGTFADGHEEVLQSLIWQSSDATVVSVTNDSSNRGTAYAVAPGTATLSACAGSTCGSLQISTTPGQ